MADSLSLIDIAAELKDVATDNKDHIMGEVYGLGENEADVENSIAAMGEYAMELDTPNEVILTKIYATKALQPGGFKTATSKVFNPSLDAVNVKPKVAKVQHIAMNFLFSQEDLIVLKKSYLSGVRSNKINSDEIPFAQHILNEISMQAKQELRLAYFNAIHNAQGTNYLQLFDGFKKQVLDAIVSAEIPAANIIDTNAITASNGVAEFEKIVAGIPTKFLNKVVCLVPRALKTAYEQNYRSLYGTLPYNTMHKKAKIDGTSIEFMVEPGLDGFTKPIFVPKNNLARLYDSSSAKSDLVIDYDARERNIAVVMDAQAGCGFADGTHIWTNDVV